MTIVLYKKWNTPFLFVSSSDPRETMLQLKELEPGIMFGDVRAGRSKRSDKITGLMYILNFN